MHKITIFTTKFCPYSKKLIDFLYEKDIPFDEVKADMNRNNALKLSKINPNIQTPTILIDNKRVLVGWNEKTKEDLLNLFNFIT